MPTQPARTPSPQPPRTPSSFVPRPAPPSPVAPRPTPTPPAVPPARTPPGQAPTTGTWGTAARSFSLRPGPGSPWPLFSSTLGSIFYARKTPFLFLLLLIPVGIGFIINAAVGMDDYQHNDAWGIPERGQSPGLLWFQDASYGILFPFLIPLVVAFFASAAIGEEVEGKTLPYLFTRPVYRNWILAAKAAAILLGVWLLAVMALTVLWFTMVSLTQSPTEHFDQLLGHYWVAGLSVLTAGGLFLFLGVLMRRAIILIALYLFVWEFAISNVPFFVAKFTLVYYVRGILLSITNRDTSTLDFQVGAASVELGHMVLLSLAVGGLLGAFYVVSNKDYNV